MYFEQGFKKKSMIRVGSLWFRPDRVESIRSENTSNTSRKELIISMFSGEIHTATVDKSEVEKIVDWVVNES